MRLIVFLLIFGLSLIITGLIYQRGFQYNTAIGSKADENMILAGFGDRENNGSFDFRWTLGKATLQIPELARPYDVKLFVSPGPRPSSARLNSITVQYEHSAPFVVSLPPLDAQGFTTVTLPGPDLALQLTPPTLTINSATFQPSGENRSLGLVVREIKVSTKSGLKLPPPFSWFGLSLLLTLLFAFSRRLFAISNFLPKFTQAAFLPFRRKSSQKIPSIVEKFSLAGLIWGAGLLLVSSLLLLWPGWSALNIGSLAWGLAGTLALALLPVSLKWQTRLAAGWLAVTLAFVFYGITTPVFGIAAWASLIFLFGKSMIAANFRAHSSNVIWLVATTVGATWGLWQSRLPRTDDLPFYHLYWINELDRLLRQGNFYPRWASDFTYGQGNAVFNYYAPGARYAAELFHLLGLTFNNAALLTQTLSIIAGGIGAYFWCCEVLRDQRAAILGALCWIFFPFTIADLYVGGGLSNTLGAAFLPYIFWLLLRLVRHKGDWRTALWVALPLGGLAFSHTPLTLLMIPVGGLFCLGVLILEYENVASLLKTIGGLALAGVVGVGISAFFILPAVVEKDLVPFFYAGFGDNAYAVWPDALALWRPIYPNLTNYSLFGTLHPLLAVVGFVLLLRRMPRRFPVFLAGLLLLMLVLQLPASAFIWNAVPLFKSIQFTSRLMDFAVVFAAPLISGLVYIGFGQIQSKLANQNTPIADASGKSTLTFWQVVSGKTVFRQLKLYVPVVVVVALMLWACFGQLQFAYWPPSFSGELSLKALQEQIKNGDPQYIPRTVTDLAAVQTFRPASFMDKRPLNAQNKLQLVPDGAINWQLLVATSTPAQVVVPIFYYPGWHAYSNGQELEIKPADQTGLITLSLPAGSQTVNLDFKDTPIRLVSNLVSITSVITLVLVAAFGLVAGSRRKANLRA